MTKDGAVLEPDGYALDRYKLTLRDERSIVVFVAIDVRLHVIRDLEVAGKHRPGRVDQFLVL